mmetsp:Transcript_32956/g.64652  ORF Transcript_32956/g.64652 Transcript_32956/m.64652 type:complete len:1994 (+) Transcript_32956:42-6023(+)
MGGRVLKLVFLVSFQCLLVSAGKNVNGVCDCPNFSIDVQQAFSRCGTKDTSSCCSYMEEVLTDQCVEYWMLKHPNLDVVIKKIVSMCNIALLPDCHFGFRQLPPPPPIPGTSSTTSSAPAPPDPTGLPPLPAASTSPPTNPFLPPLPPTPPPTDLPPLPVSPTQQQQVISLGTVSVPTAAPLPPTQTKSPTTAYVESAPCKDDPAQELSSRKMTCSMVLLLSSNKCTADLSLQFPGSGFSLGTIIMTTCPLSCGVCFQPTPRPAAPTPAPAPTVAPPTWPPTKELPTLPINPDGFSCKYIGDGTDQLCTKELGSAIEVSISMKQAWVGVGVPRPGQKTMGLADFTIGWLDDTGNRFFFQRRRGSDTNGRPDQDIPALSRNIQISKVNGLTTMTFVRDKIVGTRGNSIQDGLLWAGGVLSPDPGFSATTYHTYRGYSPLPAPTAKPTSSPTTSPPTRFPTATLKPTGNPTPKCYCDNFVLSYAVVLNACSNPTAAKCCSNVRNWAANPCIQYWRRTAAARTVTYFDRGVEACKETLAVDCTGVTIVEALTDPPTQPAPIAVQPTAAPAPTAVQPTPASAPTIPAVPTNVATTCKDDPSNILADAGNSCERILPLLNSDCERDLSGFGYQLQLWEMCPVSCNRCPKAAPTPRPTISVPSGNDCVDDKEGLLARQGNTCKLMFSVAGYCEFDMSIFGYAGALSQLCPVTCNVCTSTGSAPTAGALMPTASAPTSVSKPISPTSPPTAQVDPGSTIVVPAATKGTDLCACTGYIPPVSDLSLACPAGAAFATNECCSAVEKMGQDACVSVWLQSNDTRVDLIRPYFEVCAVTAAWSCLLDVSVYLVAPPTPAVGVVGHSRCDDDPNKVLTPPTTCPALLAIAEEGCKTDLTPFGFIDQTVANICPSTCVSCGIVDVAGSEDVVTALPTAPPSSSSPDATCDCGKFVVDVNALSVACSLDSTSPSCCFYARTYTDDECLPQWLKSNQDSLSIFEKVLSSCSLKMAKDCTDPTAAPVDLGGPTPSPTPPPTPLDYVEGCQCNSIVEGRLAGLLEYCSTAYSGLGSFDNYAQDILNDCKDYILPSIITERCLAYIVADMSSAEEVLAYSQLKVLPVPDGCPEPVTKTAPPTPAAPTTLPAGKTYSPTPKLIIPTRKPTLAPLPCVDDPNKALASYGLYCYMMIAAFKGNCLADLSSINPSIPLSSLLYQFCPKSCDRCPTRAPTVAAVVVESPTAAPQNCKCAVYSVDMTSLSSTCQNEPQDCCAAVSTFASNECIQTWLSVTDQVQRSLMQTYFEQCSVSAANDCTGLAVIPETQEEVPTGPQIICDCYQYEPDLSVASSYCADPASDLTACCNKYMAVTSSSCIHEWFKTSPPKKQEVLDRYNSCSRPLPSKCTKVYADAPELTCPSTVSATVGANQASTTVWWKEPQILDANPGSVKITSSHRSGSIFFPGSTNVSYSVENERGFSSQCFFVVEVKDTGKPVLFCPRDIYVDQGASTDFTRVSYAMPTYEDNTLNLYTPKLVSGIGSGGLFPPGRTENTFELTDVGGNTCNCSFSVVVSDLTRPVLLCPVGQLTVYVSSTASDLTAVVNYSVVATDNSGSVELKQTQGRPSGDNFPVGISDVAFLATDSSGNSVACDFTVKVSVSTPPLVICPDPIILEDVNGQGYPLFYPPPGRITGLKPPATSSWRVVSGPKGEGAFLAAGFYRAVYEVTDENTKLSARCTLSVTVRDRCPPVLTCPPSQSIPQTRVSGSVAVYDVATIKDCGNSTIQLSPPTQKSPVGLSSGSIFPVGRTEIVMEGSDRAGNVGQCSFSVVVEDVTPPRLTSCPSDQAKTVNDLVFWDAPTAIDNTEVASIVQTKGPKAGESNGVRLPEGLYNIEYTVSDQSGGKAYCRFSITISDPCRDITSCSACSSIPGCSFCASRKVCSSDTSWGTKLVCPEILVSSVSRCSPVKPGGCSCITFKNRQAGYGCLGDKRCDVICEKQKNCCADYMQQCVFD